MENGNAKSIGKKRVIGKERMKVKATPAYSERSILIGAKRGKVRRVKQYQCFCVVTHKDGKVKEWVDTRGNVRSSPSAGKKRFDDFELKVLTHYGRFKSMIEDYLTLEFELRSSSGRVFKEETVIIKSTGEIIVK